MSWEKRWSKRSDTADGNAPVVADGVFWGLVENGWFIPVELDTGAPLWRSAFPSGERYLNGVAVANELAVVTTWNAIAALRRKDGSHVWAHPIDSRAHPIDATGAPLLINADQVFDAQHQAIVARALEDGRVMWSTAVNRPRAIVAINDRLWIPTNDALVVLDQKTGAVLTRSEGPCGFALPFCANSSSNPNEPLVIASRDDYALQLLDPEARVRRDFRLNSFFTDADSTGAGRRGMIALSSGATVHGSSLFGGFMSFGLWFRLELTNGKQSAPTLTHEGQHRQYKSFASSAEHVFACTHEGTAVDVFDHQLRRLGSLTTDMPRGKFDSPLLLPTKGGGLVMAAQIVTAFSASEPGRSILALPTTDPLSPLVIAQLERLEAKSSAESPARVLQSPSGPVPLSNALSTFLATEWQKARTFRIGVPRTQLHWDGGWLLDPGMTDFRGPLVTIGFSERTQAHHVIAADDLTADPLVFEVSHEGGEPLPLGRRLSKFLEGVTAWS